MAAIDQENLGMVRWEILEGAVGRFFLLQRMAQHVSERARHLSARRAAADDDEIQRSLGYNGGISFCGFEHGQDTRT
jgi:hypothetical protein